MSEHNSERIVMQAASIDEDPRTIEALVLDALSIVHADLTKVMIRAVDSVFGWNFYLMSVDKSAVGRLATIPGGDFLSAKGDTIEQKFVNWLNRQAKKRGMDGRMHFVLASELRSSRYGLF